MAFQVSVPIMSRVMSSRFSCARLRATGVAYRTAALMLGASLLFGTSAGQASEQTAALPAGAAVEAQLQEAPMQILVSLDEQKIDVYRGATLLKSSPISSGQRGHTTPTGVFSILEKRRKHFSNIYDNAPMPYMQRLTWSGIALHQGRLPGYPASHGCIRLPESFARDLFGITDRGVHVVVTRERVAPTVISSEVLPQPRGLGQEVASLTSSTIAADPALRGAMAPTGTDETPAAIASNPHFDDPLRMIVTPREPENATRTLQQLLNRMGFDAGAPDGVIGKRTRAAVALFQEGADLPVTGQVTEGLRHAVYAAAGYEAPQNATLRIRRNFKDVYEAEVTLRDADKPIGTHVFTALNFREGDRSVDWMAVPAEGETLATMTQALDRLVIGDKVARDLSAMLTPGSSLIVTDRSFARNTGLGTDFVVVTR
ncbi:L,D-transpeptidase family protein [Roseibium aestuarii]|uniref:L,D-transpeptidase family protein n=1 Tax=Roseibium aestuarii TaxID=2600299 RepID=A0ABW4JSV4_9HYPH|nr:L,D-transpeptidase family protein [Roseibium aestuarii]